MENIRNMENINGKDSLDAYAFAIRRASGPAAISALRKEASFPDVEKVVGFSQVFR